MVERCRRVLFLVVHKFLLEFRRVGLALRLDMEHLKQQVQLMAIRMLELEFRHELVERSNVTEIILKLDQLYISRYQFIFMFNELLNLKDLVNSLSEQLA